MLSSNQRRLGKICPLLCFLLLTPLVRTHLPPLLYLGAEKTGFQLFSVYLYCGQFDLLHYQPCAPPPTHRRRKTTRKTTTNPRLKNEKNARYQKTQREQLHHKYQFFNQMHVTNPNKYQFIETDKDLFSF